MGKRMLNIEQPTLEEAGAAMLIGALCDAYLPMLARTNEAAFAMMLLDHLEAIDGRTAFAMAKKADQLLGDLRRIGKQTDTLLAAAKVLP